MKLPSKKLKYAAIQHSVEYIKREFGIAEAYEVMMGRWSRQLAPLFVEFVGVRDGENVLDVGCGTGALSATLARVTGASKIVGIDPSNGFIEYARTQVADPRVTFEL